MMRNVYPDLVYTISVCDVNLHVHSYLGKGVQNLVAGLIRRLPCLRLHIFVMLSYE